MKVKVTVVAVCLCLLAIPHAAFGQEENNDNPTITSSAAVSASAPVGSLSQFSNAGLGLDFSGGYNFTRRHAVMAEFMWNWLYATGSSLQPVRDVLQTNRVGGHGNLIAITAEYKYELRGRSLGAYLIGGTGLYHREAQLTKQIPTGTPIPCRPVSVWLWWGYVCGNATTSTTLASSSAEALGVNGGIGFTVRTGEAPYRWFVECRYHYAPTKNINTQLVTFNIGVRY